MEKASFQANVRIYCEKKNIKKEQIPKETIRVQFLHKTGLLRS